MPTKGPRTFDSGQFALRLLASAASVRGRSQSSPEHARQERDHQHAPKRRSTCGENGVRDGFHHLDQWIITGFRYSIIWHFEGAHGYSARLVPTVYYRTVWTKTSMKRTVKTPMATPISTSTVPIDPSPARGGTCCWCGKIEWETGLDAICWRTGAARAKSKRVISDLQKLRLPIKRRGRIRFRGETALPTIKGG